MIVFRYSGDGFVPATIEPKPLEEHPIPSRFWGRSSLNSTAVVKSWKLGSPAKMPFDELVVARGPYQQSFKSIRSESFYPILQGYIRLSGGGHALQFLGPDSDETASSSTPATPPTRTSPENQRLHLSLQYKRYDWKIDAK